MDKRCVLRIVTIDPTINGDFGTDTDWTKGTGWTIAAGVAHHATGTASDLEEALASLPAIGRKVEITYTVLNLTAGDVTLKAGTQAGTLRSANGTFTEILTVAGDQIMRFSASSTGVFDIDNVKVRFSTEADIANPDDGDALKSGSISEITIVNVGANKAHVAWKQDGFADATIQSTDFAAADSYTMGNKQFTDFAALAGAVGAEVDIQITCIGAAGV